MWIRNTRVILYEDVKFSVFSFDLLQLTVYFIVVVIIIIIIIIIIMCHVWLRFMGHFAYIGLIL